MGAKRLAGPYSQLLPLLEAPAVIDARCNKRSNKNCFSKYDRGCVRTLRTVYEYATD